MKKKALTGILCLTLAGGAVLTPTLYAADRPALAANKLEVETAGRVGTIDTQKLAADLGWDREMNENIKKIFGQMESELQQLKNLYDSTIQQKKKEMGITGTETGDELSKKLTQAQQRELMELINGGNQKLSQVQQYAKQQLEKYRNDWLNQYGSAIRPIVKQIAQQKKLSVVINIQQIPLMYSDPSVDITDAVFDAAKASPPKLYPVDPPKMISELFARAPATQSTTAPSVAPSIAPAVVPAVQPKAAPSIKGK